MLEENRADAGKLQSRRDKARSRIDDLTSALRERKREFRAIQDRFEHYRQSSAEECQREREEYGLTIQQQQGLIQQLLQQAARAEERFSELRAEHHDLGA